MSQLARRKLALGKPALYSACAVLAIALATRLAWITVPINSDEMLWIQRGTKFLLAILNGEPEATFLRHHPGVTNMWVIGGGMALRFSLRAFLPADDLARQGADLNSYLEALQATGVDVPLGAYTSARVVSAVVTSLCLVGFYLLSRRVLGDPIAFIATVILLLEPFFVAYQRSLTTDANQTNFMWLSLLSLFVYLPAGIDRSFGPVKRRRVWLVLSGVFFGLSLLSKLSVLLSLPAFGLYVLWWTRRQGGAKGWSRLVGNGIIWGLAALAVAFLLWPVLRANLPGTLLQFQEGLDHELEGHYQFFLGRPTFAPGAGYYLLVLLFRSSPLLLIGTGLGVTSLIVPALRRHMQGTAYLWAVLGNIIFMLAAMSVPPTKMDRYIVPLLPGMALLSAAGLVAVISRWFAKRKRENVGVQAQARSPGGGDLHGYAWVVFGVVVLQGLVLAPHFPYFLTYFNPLVGGPAVAQKVLMVGNAEGLDRAAAWLNKRPGAESAHISSWYAGSFAPYALGRPIEMDYDALPDGSWPVVNADYVVLYVNQYQRRLPGKVIDYFGPQKPVYAVRMYGVDYARVYLGPAVSPDAPALAGTDRIVNPTRLDFEEHTQLLGYELETPQVSAGEEVIAALYWRAGRPFPASDFTIYLGLVDGSGNSYGHSDSPPVGGLLPVDKWKPGQAIRDVQRVRVLPGTPPGEYNLEISLFSQEAGRALEVQDSGSPKGNRVTLGKVSIMRPKGAVSEKDGLAIANRLEPAVELAPGGTQLLGYEWREPSERTANAGEPVPIVLLWKAGEHTTDLKDASVFLRLHGTGQTWQRDIGHSVGGAYPPDRWSAGELVRDVWTALLPADVPEGRYQLDLVAVAGDVETPLVNLGTVAVRSRPRDLSGPTPAFPEVAALGEFAQLIGYDMPGTVPCDGALCLPSGEPFELVLNWKVLGEAERNYVRFVHLLDENGRIVAQRDEPPGGTGLPTTGWMAGEYIADPTSPATGELPRGRYRIAVGLYDPATGQRLSAPDGQDRIILSQSVEIR